MAEALRKVVADMKVMCGEYEVTNYAGRTEALEDGFSEEFAACEEALEVWQHANAAARLRGEFHAGSTDGAPVCAEGVPSDAR